MAVKRPSARRQSMDGVKLFSTEPVVPAGGYNNLVEDLTPEQFRARALAKLQADKELMSRPAVFVYPADPSTPEGKWQAVVLAVERQRAFEERLQERTNLKAAILACLRDRPMYSVEVAERVSSNAGRVKNILLKLERAGFLKSERRASPRSGNGRRYFWRVS